MLRPFFPSYLTEVSLPAELENEPFAFEDNGYRPEVTVRRPLFLFMVNDVRGIPSCTSGRVAILGIPNPTGALALAIPEKPATNISIVTVYDTYGLAVAHRYLKRVYELSSYYPEWILVYLLGSICLLEPDTLEVRDSTDTSKYHILYLCMYMMRALENLDASKPKMLGSLQEVAQDTLPADILSRIVGSRRVSKEIASDVQQALCTEALSYAELSIAMGQRNRFLRDVTRQTQDGSYIVVSRSLHEWRMHREGSTFILKYREETRDLDAYLGARMAMFPLSAHLAAYSKRGCNPRASLIVLLQKIRRETVTSEVYASGMMKWMTQLSCELGKKQDRVFSYIYQLGEGVDDLMEQAIFKYSQASVQV
ncbi:Hypothetical protein POVR2_LOCUS101 [uncultured virus]|nr:Hypothetical protein POVR2_LOCUS101 [uncultured virus]